MEAFAEAWGTKAPAAVMAWRNAWEDFTPFLAFTPEIRKVIYTTNQIESINYQLRKITKTRGSFPSAEAAIKLVYLGIRNIETTRGGELGTGTRGWPPGRGCRLRSRLGCPQHAQAFWTGRLFP